MSLNEAKIKYLTDDDSRALAMLVRVRLNELQYSNENPIIIGFYQKLLQKVEA